VSEEDGVRFKASSKQTAMVVEGDADTPYAFTLSLVRTNDHLLLFIIIRRRRRDHDATATTTIFFHQTPSFIITSYGYMDG